MTAMDGQPLDTRLLSDAIIELNISRRNVAIYPKGHLSVQKSLDRAYSYLERLFNLRAEISLAVAKDTLVVDDYCLDPKNPVYRELAEALSGISIAGVILRQGLSKEELYTFHKLLSDDKRHLTADNCEEVHGELEFKHISLIPIDYRAFSFEEDGRTEEGEQKDMWLRYVKGLLNGTLGSGDLAEKFRHLPPRDVANLLNRSGSAFREVSYDTVITSYLRKTSESVFSGDDLKQLMDVISRLNVGLKKDFLASSVKLLSRNAGHMEQALREIPVEEVARLLSHINEQQTFIPRSLRGLLERFSQFNHEGLKDLGVGEDIIADDFLLSEEMMHLLKEEKYDQHVPASYQEDLDKIIRSGPPSMKTAFGGDYRRRWSDEAMESSYSQLILELVSAEVPPALAGSGSGHFSKPLREQLELFAASGQYDQVLQTMEFLSGKNLPTEAAEMASEVLQSCGSREFMTLLTESFRAVGRQKREEAARLCVFYGELIVPLLMDALAEEESQSGRRFLVGLTVNMGEKAVPESRKRLRDERWHVKRNAILILRGCGAEGLNEEIRPYCRHSDSRVSLEALRYLLSRKDEYGKGLLRTMFAAKSRGQVQVGVILAGDFGLEEFLPDLTRLLGQKAKWRGDYDLKLAVVKALGQIGSREGMDGLRDVLASTSLFFRKDLQKVKTEAYRALGKIHSEGGLRQGEEHGR